MNKENEEELWWNAYVHIARFALPLMKDLYEKGSTQWSIEDKQGFANAIFAMETIVWNSSSNECFYATNSPEFKNGLEWFGKNFTRLWD
jgi:hypothetical protein